MKVKLLAALLLLSLASCSMADDPPVLDRSSEICEFYLKRSDSSVSAEVIAYEAELVIKSTLRINIENQVHFSAEHSYPESTVKIFSAGGCENLRETSVIFLEQLRGVFQEANYYEIVERITSELRELR